MNPLKTKSSVNKEYNRGYWPQSENPIHTTKTRTDQGDQLLI